MRLNKEESLWLFEKFSDIYYLLEVDEMHNKDQEIFRSTKHKHQQYAALKLLWFHPFSMMLSKVAISLTCRF